MRYILSLLLVAALAAPAEAALVYTRDGRTFDGNIRVEAANLVVVGADGRSQAVPYDQVVGISLDGRPLYAPPARPASGEGWKGDLLAWTLVLANVAAVGLAGVAIYRSTGQPAR